MPWQVLEDEYRDRIIGTYQTRSRALVAFRAAINDELISRGDSRIAAIAEGRLDYDETSPGPHDEAQADMDGVGCWHVREVS